VIGFITSPPIWGGGEIAPYFAVTVPSRRGAAESSACGRCKRCKAVGLTSILNRGHCTVHCDDRNCVELLERLGDLGGGEVVITATRGMLHYGRQYICPFIGSLAGLSSRVFSASDCGVRGPTFESHRGSRTVVCRDSRCDIQPWARAVHPHCGA